MKCLYRITAHLLTIAILTAPLTAFADITYANFEYNFSGFSNTGTKSFYRRAGTTPTSSTGPSGAADGSQYYVFLESSSGAAYTNGDTAYLQANSVTGTAVSFFYHMYGTNSGTLAFEVYSGGGWKRLWEVSGQQHVSSSAAWTEQSVSLAFYPGSKNVRFVAIAKGGYLGDIAIDEIRFFAATSSSVSYQYDALGRIICVEDPTNGDRDFDYDDAGNRSNVTVGACND